MNVKKKFERKDLFNVFLWDIQIEKISFLIKRNLLFCVWQLIRFLFFSISTFLTKEEFLFFCSHFLASFSDKRIVLPLLISVCLSICLTSHHFYLPFNLSPFPPSFLLPIDLIWFLSSLLILSNKNGLPLFFFSVFVSIAVRIFFRFRDIENLVRFAFEKKERKKIGQRKRKRKRCRHFQFKITKILGIFFWWFFWICGESINLDVF